jgi:hypothetical protein
MSVDVKVGLIDLQQFAQDKQSTSAQTSVLNVAAIWSRFLGFLFFIFVKKDLNCFALSLTFCLNDLKFTCIGF